MRNRQCFAVLCFVLGLWSTAISDVGVKGEMILETMSATQNDEDTYTFALPAKRRLGWSQGEIENVERKLSSKSTKAPTFKSTKAPTFKSTKAPTFKSTKAPTFKSTKAPTFKSTKAPTFKSTKAPTFKSTKAPTFKSTKAPTFKSTKAPTCKSEKSTNIFC